MDAIVTWVQENWAMLATVLLGISEALANVPVIKQNSIFEIVVALLKKVSPVKA